MGRRYLTIATVPSTTFQSLENEYVLNNSRNNTHNEWITILSKIKKVIRKCLNYMNLAFQISAVFWKLISHTFFLTIGCWMLSCKHHSWCFAHFAHFSFLPYYAERGVADTWIFKLFLNYFLPPQYPTKKAAPKLNLERLSRAFLSFFYRMIIGCCDSSAQGSIRISSFL